MKNWEAQVEQWKRQVNTAVDKKLEGLQQVPQEIAKEAIQKISEQAKGVKPQGLASMESVIIQRIGETHLSPDMKDALSKSLMDHARKVILNKGQSHSQGLGA